VRKLALVMDDEESMRDLSEDVTRRAFALARDTGMLVQRRIPNESREVHPIVDDDRPSPS